MLTVYAEIHTQTDTGCGSADAGDGGKAHFVYHEANREEGVTFQLENNRYLYQGEYDFDEDGMAGREVKKGFIRLVSIDVPELTEENQFDWLTGVNQTIYEINEKETGDQF